MLRITLIDLGILFVDFFLVSLGIRLNILPSCPVGTANLVSSRPNSQSHLNIWQLLASKILVSPWLIFLTQLVSKLSTNLVRSTFTSIQNFTTSFIKIFSLPLSPIFLHCSQFLSISFSSYCFIFSIVLFAFWKYLVYLFSCMFNLCLPSKCKLHEDENSLVCA